MIPFPPIIHHQEVTLQLIPLQMTYPPALCPYDT